MPDLEEIFAAIRAGREVLDSDFHQAYPEPVRRLAELNFTPIDVARRAARMLVAKPGARVLDIGSGAGKFCVVGALTTDGSFTGIEIDDRLVAIARQFQIPRVRFVHGDMALHDLDGYDGFYLFNPFPQKLRVRAVEHLAARLAASRPGTRVVTFHGMGGELPASYQRTHGEAHGVDALELWVKS